jgi:hypothetical protein
MKTEKATRATRKASQNGKNLNTLKGGKLAAYLDRHFQSITDQNGGTRLSPTEESIGFIHGRIAYVRSCSDTGTIARYVTLSESLTIMADIQRDANRSQSGGTDPENIARWYEMIAKALQS